MTTTTLRDTPTIVGDLSGATPVWTLVVAHHPLRALVGLRRVLLAETHVALERDGLALGAGGLDDARLSRKHARVSATRDGALIIEDTGSSNGTWVNERPITLRELDTDDVVRVGSIVLVVQRAPARVPSLPPDVGLNAAWPMSRVFTTLCELPPRRVVVVWAEPHTGVTELLEWLHQREAPNAPLIRLSTTEKPLGLTAESTVCLGPVASLAEPSLAARVLALRQTARRVVLWCELSPGDQDAYELTAHPDFAALDPCALRVPPLRERIADLPSWVDLFSRRHFGQSAALHHQLVAAMLLAPWPGNLAELEGFVAAHLGPAAGPLRLSDDTARLLRHPREATRPQDAVGPRGTTPKVHFRIAANGHWFETPDGVRVAVHPRRALVNLLRALVSHHVGLAPEALSTAKLVEAGWPGERLIGASGPTRVYVALSTLRRLGLREAIQRDGDGYRLGGAAVEIDVA